MKPRGTSAQNFVNIAIPLLLGKSLVVSLQPPHNSTRNTRKYKKCISPRHSISDTASLFPAGGVGTKGVQNSGKLLAEGNKTHHPRGTFHLNQKIKPCKNQEPDGYEFTLGKKNQSMFVLHRDFHVQCSSVII